MENKRDCRIFAGHCNERVQIIRMGKEDLLILKTTQLLDKEKKDEIEQEFEQRFGIQAKVLCGNLDVFGVIRHGS